MKKENYSQPTLEINYYSDEEKVLTFSTGGPDLNDPDEYE